MRSLFAVFLLTIVPLSAAAQQNDARMLRVEQWLKAVLHHQPGEFDAAAQQVSRLSQSEMEALALDVRVLTQLMRDPRLSYFTVTAPNKATVQQVRFTPKQMDRMRILTCAAAGLVKERWCMERKALAQLDNDLLRLGELVAAARKQGDSSNYLLRRGAMLHADVAMSSGAELFQDAPPPAAGRPQRITISIDDGRDQSMYLGVIHWEIGRALLEAVRPAGDLVVRLWFHTTSAWMQARGYHENADHLAQALRMFPRDADLLFLSGCEHESFARPSIQAAVRSVRLPPGFELAVKSDEAELREAEVLFRRALAINPDHVEARLRLGRVLFLRGRAREAADELRRASATAAEDVMKYYAALFLGAAEEALGNHDAADARYERASSLYPNAQSPHLAQGALARRRGDLIRAEGALERVFRLAAAFPEGDDPWWTYDREAGRNAEALMNQLRERFREAQP